MQPGCPRKLSQSREANTSHKDSWQRRPQRPAHFPRTAVPTKMFLVFTTPPPNVPVTPSLTAVLAHRPIPSTVSMHISPRLLPSGSLSVCEPNKLSLHGSVSIVLAWVTVSSFSPVPISVLDDGTAGWGYCGLYTFHDLPRTLSSQSPKKQEL